MVESFDVKLQRSLSNSLSVVFFLALSHWLICGIDPILIFSCWIWSMIIRTGVVKVHSYCSYFSLCVLSICSDADRQKLVLNLCPLLSMGQRCTLCRGMWWLLCPSDACTNVSIYASCLQCIMANSSRVHLRIETAGNCIIGCFHLWCNHPVDAEKPGYVETAISHVRLTDNHTTDVPQSWISYLAVWKFIWVC